MEEVCCKTDCDLRSAVTIGAFFESWRKPADS